MGGTSVLEGEKSDSSLINSNVFSLVLVHSNIAIESETIQFALDLLGGKWSYSSSICVPKGQVFIYVHSVVIQRSLKNGKMGEHHWGGWKNMEERLGKFTPKSLDRWV